jgi:DNA-binding XRE family transcriptional regulator
MLAHVAPILTHALQSMGKNRRHMGMAALRKAAGLSQVQLAKAVGIPQRTLSFYEVAAVNLR